MSLQDLQKSLKESLGKLSKTAETTEKANGSETVEKSYPKGLNPGTIGNAPNIMRTPVNQQSRGYSFIRALGFARGMVSPDEAAEEIEVSKQLKGLYSSAAGLFMFQGRSFLVPFDTSRLPNSKIGGCLDDGALEKFKKELREKTHATVDGFDPDEAEWYRKKALGTIDDTAGGTLRALPSLGEIIDLQRNLEVFSNAGASQVTLPPSGHISYPKLTGGAVAYWVGEGAASTPSEQATGSLLLSARKLVVRVPINLELFRFTDASTEAMLRMDMAKQGALEMDRAALYGTGGTQPKGLFTYPTVSSWSQNVDALLTHTASTTANDGNTFEPQDFMKMISKLPDGVDPTAYVMRRDLFGALSTRRADAVTAADGKGPFVFNLIRQLGDGMPAQINGVKAVLSSQVAANEVKGSGTTLTSVLAGDFRDWIIGRFGVMEFEANPWGDTAFNNYQVSLRAVQFVDAGARHAASFVRCAQLLVA